MSNGSTCICGRYGIDSLEVNSLLTWLPHPVYMATTPQPGPQCKDGTGLQTNGR